MVRSIGLAGNILCKYHSSKMKFREEHLWHVSTLLDRCVVRIEIKPQISRRHLDFTYRAKRAQCTKVQKMQKVNFIPVPTLLFRAVMG